MATKITSPVEGFTGRTVFGPTTLTFKDGVAETDEKLSDGLKAYLKGRGYKVGRAKASDDSQQDGDQPFDPAQHNQDQVIEYLERDGQSADEIERVLAAEAARETGARQKVAKWAEARKADAEAKGDGGETA